VTIPQARLRSLRTHDDGINAWRVADVAPPPQLAGLILGYGDYTERTGGFTTRRELPHAGGVLIVNFAAPLAIVGGDGREIVLQAGEAFVAGAHLRPALSRSGGMQAGMHVFLPLSSLRRLLGLPMHELADRVVPLDALLGADARRLGDALAGARTAGERINRIDAALTARFAATSPLGAAERHGLALLRGRPDLDIAEVARRVGWSRKHLAGRVRDAVGVGPRSWRRLIRFERLTARLAGDPAPDWAGLAHDMGYCDQPHLNREFREMTGMTPSAFLARSLPDGGGLIEG